MIAFRSLLLLCRTLSNKQRLGFEVILHSAMKIQVIPRQISEDSDGQTRFPWPDPDLRHEKKPRSRRYDNPSRRTDSAVPADQTTPASSAGAGNRRSPISYWTVPIKPVDWPARSSRCLIRKVVVLLPLVPVTPIIFILRDG